MKFAVAIFAFIGATFVGWVVLMWLLRSPDPGVLDLQEFAEKHHLPYDPTGRVDMTETFHAAIAAAHGRNIALKEGPFRIDSPANLTSTSTGETK